MTNLLYDLDFVKNIGIAEAPTIFKKRVHNDVSYNLHMWNANFCFKAKIGLAEN